MYPLFTGGGKAVQHLGGVHQVDVDQRQGSLIRHSRQLAVVQFTATRHPAMPLVASRAVL